MFFDCTCGLATAVLSLATDLLRALAAHDVHACLLRTTVCGVASLSAFCCRCDVIVIEVEEVCYCCVCASDGSGERVRVSMTIWILQMIWIWG